ncbi:helix-turn-helix domain-containing protein [Pengzhenrongella sicca]|uniref:Helix-turn-helix domain-containing protein n=1 Tax=Pengzhenrongella sicca TaxID=2819238 RepID=A0A8A4ZFG2_9MICO|nr:helix-turn-helix domain-containing protein [Pengzhenrongella sicca]QTE30035.1 helix-turn-helix domain-containing protein [Pengzhenrongella sicca]
MTLNTHTFRLVQSEAASPTRRAAAPEPQVINLTVPAEQLLLTVVEAAHRLGISRSLMYELIAAGEIQTVHIRRLCKIDVRSIDAFIQSRIAAESVPSQIAMDR